VHLGHVLADIPIESQVVDVGVCGVKARHHSTLRASMKGGGEIPSMYRSDRA
jgi:hypothetical protein